VQWLFVIQVLQLAGFNDVLKHWHSRCTWLIGASMVSQDDSEGCGVPSPAITGICHKARGCCPINVACSAVD
jgi:hypothetical protein